MDQIASLVPASFECSTELRNGTDILSIRGKASTLYQQPLRVDFNARKGSKVRTIFDQQLAEAMLHDRTMDLEFACTFWLTGQTVKTSLFQISGHQSQFLELSDRLYSNYLKLSSI